MDIETIIDAFHDTLIHWGVTPSILAGIGIFSLVTLFFSVRIVLIWYLGVQRVQDQIQSLSRQIFELQTQISKLQLKRETLPEERPREAAGSSSGRNETFRLNH